MWDYYLSNHQSSTILRALKHLFGLLKHQHQIYSQKIECDNKIFMKWKAVRNWLNEQHIKIEASPPYTQSQNGAAEHSAAVIKNKARAMREATKLPTALWPEVDRAAVYLHNWTSRYQYNWKSPYECFHTYLALWDGVIRPNHRPQQAHLKVYRCKAFALTREYYKKKDRLQQFNPKAWIGYLIGYDSTNVYKIWNPIRNEIFRTRDVIFNEREHFNGNLQ